VGSVHGAPELASLFDTPAGETVTPGVLDGTWTSTRPIVFTTSNASSGPGGHTPHMALHITPTTITNATQCSFSDGTVLYAGESAPFTIDASAGNGTGTITVLPSKSGDGDTESYQVYQCQSMLKPGTVTFHVSGVTLDVSGGPYDNGQFVKTSN
jgi:hypothetical protein